MHVAHHSDACVAAKRGMHRIVRQDLAVDAVIGDRWHGPDDVRWVDVLDVRSLQHEWAGCVRADGSHAAGDACKTLRHRAQLQR